MRIMFQCFSSNLFRAACVANKLKYSVKMSSMNGLDTY